VANTVYAGLFPLSLGLALPIFGLQTVFGDRQHGLNDCDIVPSAVAPDFATVPSSSTSVPTSWLDGAEVRNPAGGKHVVALAKRAPRSQMQECGPSPWFNNHNLSLFTGENGLVRTRRARIPCVNLRT
jgi:hypothetical protein